MLTQEIASPVAKDESGKGAGYQYSAAVIRNPFRFALAVLRTLRDPSNYYEFKMVEVGFARSRLGRRFSRWNDVADAMRRDPRTAARLEERRPIAPIDLDALERLPAGTLGRVVAQHCRKHALNPNLGEMPADSEEDWILNDLYQTHDLWHVVTGWGNDPLGEIGVTGFYIAQMRGPRFLAFLLSLFCLSAAVFSPRQFDERMEAISRGYAQGKRAQPLFGVNWAELWALPIEEVRRQFDIDVGQAVGEGIEVAA